jgi:hypothetical protein
MKNSSYFVLPFNGRIECSNGFGNFKFYNKIQQKMLDWGYDYSLDKIKKLIPEKDFSNVETISENDICDLITVLEEERLIKRNVEPKKEPYDFIFATLFCRTEEGNFKQIGNEIGIPYILKDCLNVPEEYKGYGIKTFWEYNENPYEQRIFTDNHFLWSNNINC